MPNTYTPIDAFDIAKLSVRNFPLEDIKHRAFDIINSTMWTTYPWRWARQNLTAIALVNDQQDYSMASADSAVYLKLLNARITRTDLTRNQIYPLIPTSFLQVDPHPQGTNTIEYISYVQVDDTFRLNVPVQINSPQTSQIDGEIHITPTKQTSSTENTAFDFPDHYFDVFVQGLKWYFFDISEDDRAGTVRIDRRGERIYTGQLGVFHDALQEMIRAEDIADAAGHIHPMEGSIGSNVATGGNPFLHLA